MADLWDDLNERVKSLAGSWPSYTALGSFALYLLGYLALRFHLTALGVGTDLNVIDERYLFTGAKFVVFLVATIPILMLIIGPIALVLYFLYRVAGRRPNLRTGLLANPNTLCAIGIVLSVFLIQFVMRQCFFFSNLLMACELPGPVWLRALLLQKDDGLRSLYFSGLVGGCALTSLLLLLAVKSKPERVGNKYLIRLLGALVGIQFLLLPVNYGTLIMDKTLPKVADLGGQSPLSDTQTAWLVWEGQDGMTYLVRKTGAKEQRSLITLARKDVKRTEINGYDPILSVLFGRGETCIP